MNYTTWKKHTFPQLCCTCKTAKQHWLSFMSSRLSQIFPCTRPFQMHILTKKFKFYKFQKSDLILSEIGCTVINVYIPSKKMSLHFTWILNLYNSTKYEVACWVFFLLNSNIGQNVDENTLIWVIVSLLFRGKQTIYHRWHCLLIHNYYVELACMQYLRQLTSSC